MVQFSGKFLINSGIKKPSFDIKSHFFESSSMVLISADELVFQPSGKSPTFVVEKSSYANCFSPGTKSNLELDFTLFELDEDLFEVFEEFSF